MKITIEPTSKIVICKPGMLESGIPARIWEGQTESGIKVHCVITRIGVDKDEPRTEEFKNELLEIKVPSGEIEAMREIPILFSTPMVQAILDLLKGMTRRLRGLEKINVDPSAWYLQTLFLHATGRFTFAPVAPMHPIADADIIEVKCPYGQPGDILWVRETFAPLWKATEFKANARYYEDGAKDQKWKPSIHMPKKIARIWLQLAEIRVERLQEITEEDSIAEGVTLYGPFGEYKGSAHPKIKGHFNAYKEAKRAFQNIWETINGRESWKANPWVWVIKFEVLSITGKPQICYKTNEVCKYDCKGLCRENM